MLFKSINRTRYSYTFDFPPYFGRSKEDGGKCYIKGVEPIVHYLVETLEKNTTLTRRFIRLTLYANSFS